MQARGISVAIRNIIKECTPRKNISKNCGLIISNLTHSSKCISSNIKTLQNNFLPIFHDNEKVFQQLREKFQNLNPAVRTQGTDAEKLSVNTLRPVLMMGIFGIAYRRSLSEDNKVNWTKPVFTPRQLEESIVHRQPMPRFKIYDETMFNARLDSRKAAESGENDGQRSIILKRGHVAERVKIFSDLSQPVTAAMKDNAQAGK
ncbi:hypothetical protein [Rouxiella badensis]|jgi:hypothetical protein|uniref:Uncharacterized protein n=1 Tax=Rouxiella badensis TaxID=1646377 RepID=A0A1X0WER7_9GAMM|nr:hypothetical protein [Rouxiella badensis]MCC3703783.1 hypothetical protein [Rouxiella badensis]MCC3749246.1 hypothetical protein [Rouxiella badensis]ORJ25296.1 hypothetical protein BS640_11805 [Rouxiella badensis]QII36661.1 hypothetical protein G3M83_02605 [Rouxiella badensis]QOI56349.1 hypothetical protein H2866_04195 [Rouxiella badensis subsp. acadiensis]